MNPRPLLLAVGICMASASCRQTPPAGEMIPTPAPVRVYNQYQPGDTLELAHLQLGLDRYPVRYRGGMEPGTLGAIYFLPDGNLHIEARKVGETWVMTTRPVLEPSTAVIAARVAAWDAAADPQHIRSRSGQ